MPFFLGGALRCRREVSISMWKSDNDAMLGKITRDVEELKQDLTKAEAMVFKRRVVAGDLRLEQPLQDGGAA